MTALTDRPLRVLHVFGRLERGGAELRTIELAESFAGERVRSDFAVLTGRDGVLDDRVRAVGGDVIKCPLGPHFPLSFYRLLRERQYDVVHSHVHFFSGVILTIARAAGVPGRVAHFRMALYDDRLPTVLRRLRMATCRRLIDSSATDILAVGEGTMDVTWGGGWRSDCRCRVVYNGLPPSRVQATSVRVPLPPAIVNVGSIQPLKNQLRLVGILRRSLAAMPDLRLRLVGKEIGDYGIRIRRTAAEAGLADRVEFVGEVDDAIPAIASASLMIMPSLWEGLPGAALEACAIGIPVLAADLPGTRELAGHFPDVHVLPLNAADDAWAAAAVRLIQAGPRPAADASAHFARSPFALERARAVHFEIWSRSRASA